MRLPLFFNDEGDFADLCHPLTESFSSQSEQGRAAFVFKNPARQTRIHKFSAAFLCLKRRAKNTKSCLLRGLYDVITPRNKARLLRTKKVAATAKKRFADESL